MASIETISNSGRKHHFFVGTDPICARKRFNEEIKRKMEFLTTWYAKTFTYTKENKNKYVFSWADGLECFCEEMEFLPEDNNIYTNM